MTKTTKGWAMVSTLILFIFIMFLSGCTKYKVKRHYMPVPDEVIIADDRLGYSVGDTVVGTIPHTNVTYKDVVLELQ